MVNEVAWLSSSATFSRRISDNLPKAFYTMTAWQGPSLRATSPLDPNAATSLGTIDVHVRRAQCFALHLAMPTKVT
jgi:hypothetical protein